MNTFYTELFHQQDQFTTIYLYDFYLDMAYQTQMLYATAATSSSDATYHPV